MRALSFVIPRDVLRFRNTWSGFPVHASQRHVKHRFTFNQSAQQQGVEKRIPAGFHHSTSSLQHPGSTITVTQAKETDPLPDEASLRLHTVDFINVVEAGSCPI